MQIPFRILQISVLETLPEWSGGGRTQKEKPGAPGLTFNLL
jgi:hypothetical protein